MQGVFITFATRLFPQYINCYIVLVLSFSLKDNCNIVTLTMYIRLLLKWKTVLKISRVRLEVDFSPSTLGTNCSNSSIIRYSVISVPVRPTPAEQWTKMLIISDFCDCLINCRTSLIKVMMGAVSEGAPKSGQPVYCMCVNSNFSCEVSENYKAIFYIRVFILMI